MREGAVMREVHKRYVANPFLPLDQYIPDGEPHVFGDRVYLFGSHDKEDGDSYCMLPYVVFSAPVDDLSHWSCPGVSYDGWKDPVATEERHHTYAPDVVQGKDGRFYLYYCLSGRRGHGGYWGPISVAVCDTPDGEYEYYGAVRNPDGSIYNQYVAFDPAVINDGGTIRLYYGALYPFEDLRNPLTNSVLDRVQSEMFHKTKEELHADPEGVMGPITVVLEDDMLTASGPSRRIMPTRVKGTQWQKHPFYEGSSIRKIGDFYYFIYSSRLNHELCYATSRYPDRDFQFRGTIVSTGDIGYQGRKPKDRLNATGTTHGSIENINGKCYVFYHRLTHGTDYSRQACAEEITILPDGGISQVEVTSCGLNSGPLPGKGRFPAVICCNLTNKHMPHGSNKKHKNLPCVSSGEGKQFITNIRNHTWIGYKYFDFQGAGTVALTIRGKASGVMQICTELDGTPLAQIKISETADWREWEAVVGFPPGKRGLFLHFQGKGTLDLLEIQLM